jgi:hypothetical protein
MHVTDWFTTLPHAAGAAVPGDRVIDGVNQLPWLVGQDAASQRDGYLYWMGPEMHGSSGATSSSPSSPRPTPPTRSASCPHRGSST